jgi:uncharacterized protein YndB with AHSA1/START domain
MNVATKPHLDLSLRRTFNATPERLFRAWTQAEQLVKWFGPEGVTTEVAEVDLKVGGAYRVVMRTPQGNLVVHHGVYREIQPNQKLVFTWILDGQHCEGSEEEYCETVVTIYFNENEGATELVIIHDFLPTEKARDNHEFGWNGCFECLEKLVVQQA